MRQPGRRLYSDFTEHTFSRFCDKFLSTKNFLRKKSFGGNKVIVPDWSICMADERELRREGIRLTTEEGVLNSARSVERLSERSSQNGKTGAFP